MSALSPQPVGDAIEEIRRSAVRVSASLAGLDDAEVREPSTLPGWSRARVVGHLVQSADAYLWLLSFARTGSEPCPRPDPVSTARALEEWAQRPSGELAAALAHRVDLLVDAAVSLPGERWGTLVRAAAGWHHPAWYVLRRCWRELETHHVDLVAGYRSADWPCAYVAWALDDTLGTLAAQAFPIARVEATDLARTWTVSGTGPAVCGPGHAVLSWLSGRCGGDALGQGLLPAPPAWPQPPRPGWG